MGKPPVMRATWGLLLGLAGSLLTATAQPAALAHGIESSLQRLNDLRAGLSNSGYQLDSSFSSGEPAGDALVRVVPPGGGPGVELGRTNAQGRLTFRLPPQARSDWELQVDAGPGHRDYLEIPGTGAAQPMAIGPMRPSRWRPLVPATATALAVVGLLGYGLGRQRL